MTIAEYSTHTLKLGERCITYASATARGSMYVYGWATETTWVTGSIYWYRKGCLAGGGTPPNCFHAWIKAKFQAIDITAGGALVEKVILDKGMAWSDEGTWCFDQMDISLTQNHYYKFALYVEVHADALGVGAAIADFGGIWWSDSRIEWGYIDVPNVELNQPNHHLTVYTYRTTGLPVHEVGMYIDGVRYYSPVYPLEVSEGTHTVTVDVEYYRPGYVYTFQYWNDDYGYSTSRTRTVYIDSDTFLKAYYLETYIGGGCPTLFVWNGSGYVEEVTLDIHAGSDVTVQHRMEETLVSDGPFYKLSLRELDEFTSHVDYVKLYAVDADGEWHECYLTRAVHSELGNVKRPLKFDDGGRVDLAPQQTVDLEFFLPRIDEVAYFVFEINGYNSKPV